jgi:hypothetical protein
MRIVLKQERMLCVLENPISLVHNEDADNEVMIEYKCYVENNEHATYVKLASMLLRTPIFAKVPPREQGKGDSAPLPAQVPTALVQFQLFHKVNLNPQINICLF